MKNLFRALLIIACAAIALAVGSVHAQGSTLPQAMLGSTWYLVTIDDAHIPATSLTSASLTIQFSDDNSMNGNGGCNSFGGEYTTGTNNAISFRQIISSMMACADASVNQLEAVYKRALDSVSQYRLSDSELQLSYDNGQGVLTFVNSLSAAQGVAAPLATPTSTNWPRPTEAATPTPTFGLPSAFINVKPKPNFDWLRAVIIIAGLIFSFCTRNFWRRFQPDGKYWWERFRKDE